MYVRRLKKRHLEMSCEIAREEHMSCAFHYKNPIPVVGKQYFSSKLKDGLPVNNPNDVVIEMNTMQTPLAVRSFAH